MAVHWTRLGNKSRFVLSLTVQECRFLQKHQRIIFNYNCLDIREHFHSTLEIGRNIAYNYLYIRSEKTCYIFTMTKEIQKQRERRNKWLEEKD